MNQMNSVKIKGLVYDFDGAETLLPADSDFSRYTVIPGFCDVHVHFREPGFCYKETMRTGTLAAARGGYTDVCTMPNLNPVPDSVEHMKVQLEAIRKDACIHVYPYASITVGEKGQEFSDMEGLAPFAIGFSDDGKGIQDAAMMREAMLRAKDLGKMIVAHCEVDELVKGGCIHDGAWAWRNGFFGISSESEWRQVERDVNLAAETGCSYHVCHVSTKESVRIIREAKKSGIDVTCETGPHYLLLTDEDLKDLGRYKMNPPVRGFEDREALLEGICDGTVDMIATDHAPHSAEEKAKGLKGSSFGIVGLETAFPLLYTELVLKNVLTLEALVGLLTVKPRERFKIPYTGGYSVWDLRARYEIDPAEFVSMGKATPFEGMAVSGRNMLTVSDGQTVYKQE